MVLTERILGGSFTLKRFGFGEFNFSCHWRSDKELIKIYGTIAFRNRLCSYKLSGNNR